MYKSETVSSSCISSQAFGLAITIPTYFPISSRKDQAGAMFTKLVLTTILVGVALADTSESDEFVQSAECDLPELPSFFFTGLSTLPDPLEFDNFTLDTSEEEDEQTTGTYSFFNGMLEGLSNVQTSFDYSNNRLSANVAVKRIQLTGIYEIINGRVILPLLYVENLSGSGPFFGLIAELNASISFDVQNAITTGYTSVANLSLDISFENITISAENLLMDDLTFDWDLINLTIKPVFQSLWPVKKAAIEQWFEEEFNDILQACTMKDVMEIVKPSRSRIVKANYTKQ